MYTIDEHRHRFAAWAASRAASVKGCRFSVEQGRAMLDAVELQQFTDPTRLPGPDSVSVDKVHCKWRTDLIEHAESAFRLPFTHGVAAKLINMYLKAAVVCAAGAANPEPRVATIHPPIDGLLLDSLAKADVSNVKRAQFWREMRAKGWSKFNELDYQTVIDRIREVVTGREMWTIEEHWRGYR